LEEIRQQKEMLRQEKMYFNALIKDDGVLEQRIM